jgi:hypothetical protein
MSRFSAARPRNRREKPAFAGPARKLLVWTVLAIAAIPPMFSPLGCVIPVGPDFRDPERVENLPPFFTGSEPFFERILAAPQTFTVRIQDRNPLDLLYVRWVSDYPIYAQASSRLLEAKNEVVQGDGETSVSLTILAGCGTLADPATTNHRLVVIVADRPFVEPPERASNPDYRYNAATEKAQPIMGGWTVTCQ